MSQRLVVNPIVCDAHAMCAELFPERVTLDDWGYPIIDPTPVTDELLAHAQRAVAACPVFALKLAKVARQKEPRARPRAGQRTSR